MATPPAPVATYGRLSVRSQPSWHARCVEHPDRDCSEILGVNEYGYIFRCSISGGLFVARAPAALEPLS